jgi:hypothetical protein
LRSTSTNRANYKINKMRRGSTSGIGHPAQHATGNSRADSHRRERSLSSIGSIGNNLRDNSYLLNVTAGYNNAPQSVDFARDSFISAQIVVSLRLIGANEGANRNQIGNKSPHFDSSVQEPMRHLAHAYPRSSANNSQVQTSHSQNMETNFSQSFQMAPRFQSPQNNFSDFVFPVVNIPYK